jgi:aminotransferase EvaB
MLKVNDLARHHAPLLEELSSAMTEVLSSGWYVLGTRVDALERAFAEFCGTGHAVGVGNGTDALEVALRALDVGPGAEVITVANAGMYATTAIEAVGATPVFADVDVSTMTMDVASLERAVSPRSKAIILTHLYGRLADVQAILAVAGRCGVPVIEDCAQAHGAALAGRRAGSFGILGCFSFYPTKNLGACGDGGCVVTSSEELARKVRSLRQYGWSDKYRATVRGGRNSRLDELQAAVLLVKLPHLPEWNARRCHIAQRYSSEIRHPKIEVPVIEPGLHVAHLYVVRSPERDALREHLKALEIAAEVHYPVPDHRQPVLSDRFRSTSLPVTELLAARVLTLPCYPEMTDAEVSKVIQVCNTWHPIAGNGAA